ncbi:helix-turn-helix domain-containing protein [Streptomyces sp. NA04227]|uniref:PucR family transcriptional regulator n=1 Tax=Streptomyces sp. NA04227 TaxID=2742136 RepID=UPI0015909151|nr:helix-turn-helix domain-containing protein [Streptomyces sp. NA04227]QKW09126.1 helix-turn-helix domain-containing protein [Streptomyces sp. NA04227]
MNEHGTVPRTLAHGEALTIAGRPLHELLLEHSRELVGLVVVRLAETVPTYAALPREALRGEIASIVELNVAMCAEVLRTGSLPSTEQLDALREAATRRAEEGVALDAVVSAYHVGLQLCLDEVLGRAGPDDLPSVLDGTAWVLRFLQVTTSAASGGYVLAHKSAVGEEYTARQALLSALLDGGPAQDTAARAGLALPECYLVLSLGVGPHPDELTSGVDSTVAARRKLRRLRVELERHVAGGVLTMLTAEGGLALVPYGTLPEKLGPRDWQWLAGVLDHLVRVCGAEVTAGVAAAVPDDVPQAVRLSAEVREVAGVFDRGPGLHRLDDLLLEYQLTRPGPARARLAALLEPLSARPDLLHTLRTHLDSSLDRRVAAARLQVHPNTVDYRLRKVALLTGLDTGDPADVPRVRAALAALDAAGPPAV